MLSGDGGNFTSVQLRFKKFCILDDGRSSFLPVTSGKVESTDCRDSVFAKTLGWSGHLEGEAARKISHLHHFCALSGVASG